MWNFLSSNSVSTTLEPERKIVIFLELTKKFEEILCAKPSELRAHIRQQEEARGEFVFAFELAPLAENLKEEIDLERIGKNLRELVALGAGQKILVIVAQQLGMKKNAAYDLSLKILDK